MIVEIDNEVFTALKTKLSGKATVLGEYPETQPTFPCVVFTEMSNNSYENSVDSSGENHNEVSFQIDIFSNAQNKRTQVKSIRKDVDDIMSETYNMVRGFSGSTPNYVDTNVYKYTLRYTCVTDKNKLLYRR